ncbi:MAG: TIGR01777 family oxidoreductase [Bacteroides sp.]
MKKIVITGGTGYLGAHLVARLKERYQFVVLTRYPYRYRDSETVSYEAWDGVSLLTSYLDGSYAVINLIGENIGLKPWTAKQKKRILSSRVQAATAIQKSVEACRIKPSVWIQASATGYYGQLGETGLIYDEGSLKGENSFLADVCEAWEKPILQTDANIRKVIIRTGLVLSKDSLLMKQLLLPFYLGVAVVPDTGKNSLPWISLEDELGAIEFLLDSKYLSGIFNLASPCDHSMLDLVQALKKHKRTWLTLHLPRWLLDLFFGKEKVKEVVLADQRVAPKALMNTLFEFKHPKLVQCIAWCFDKPK